MQCQTSGDGGHARAFTRHSLPGHFPLLGLALALSLSPSRRQTDNSRTSRLVAMLAPGSAIPGLPPAHPTKRLRKKRPQTNPGINDGINNDNNKNGNVVGIYCRRLAPPPPPPTPRDDERQRRAALTPRDRWCISTGRAGTGRDDPQILAAPAAAGPRASAPAQLTVGPARALPEFPSSTAAVLPRCFYL